MKFIDFKKNKRKIIIIVILFVLCITITAIILFNNKKSKETIKLKDNLKVEINSELKLLSLLSDENKVKIVSKNKKIDTSTLGEKELVIKYKDNKKEKDYRFVINIVDTIKPKMEYKKVITTKVGTKIDLLKDVKVSDNSKEKIKATIEGKYDFNSEGTYNLKYIAVDSSNNKAEEKFVLKVEKGQNKNLKKVTTTEKHTNANNNKGNNQSNSNNTYENKGINQNDSNNTNDNNGAELDKKIERAKQYFDQYDKLYDTPVSFDPEPGIHFDSIPLEFYWMWYDFDGDGEGFWDVIGSPNYIDYVKGTTFEPNRKGSYDGEKVKIKTYYVLSKMYKVSL